MVLKVEQEPMMSTFSYVHVVTKSFSLIVHNFNAQFLHEIEFYLLVLSVKLFRKKTFFSYSTRVSIIEDETRDKL